MDWFIPWWISEGSHFRQKPSIEHHSTEVEAVVCLFCWTETGWEAYPLDKLCDLLKGYKRLVLKMTCRSIISSLLGWDVTSSCRELQYLSGWCGSHKIRWSLQVVLAYTPKNQREITLGKAQSSTNIYNSRLPKSGFSCSPPKKAQPPVSWPQSPRRLQDLRMQTAPESSTDGPTNAGGEAFVWGESFLLKSCKAFLVEKKRTFHPPCLNNKLGVGNSFPEFAGVPKYQSAWKNAGLFKKVTNFVHVPFLASSIKINKASNTVDAKGCPFERFPPNRGEESWKCCICCCQPPFFGAPTLEPPTRIDTTWQSWACDAQ